MSSSRPIAFIPGWGFQASIAEDCFSASIQLVDLPLLKTSHPTIEMLCHEIEEKILPRDVVLIGWSLGGLVSIKLYDRHPSSYKALILITSTPCFWAQSDWPGISKDHQMIFMKNLNREYLIFSDYYLKLILQPLHFSKLHFHLQSHMIPKDVFKCYKSYKDILFQSDLLSEFSKIQIPTLLIQGGKDAIIPMEVSQHLVKLNPHLEYYTIPTAGHIPFVTHQNETQTVIETFLKKIS